MSDEALRECQKEAKAIVCQVTTGEFYRGTVKSFDDWTVYIVTESGTVALAIQHLVSIQVA